MSAAPPCGWRRSRVLRCWPCRAADPARMPGDLPALLHRCGAYVTATGSGPWAAAVRLPLSPALPLREPPAPADLVLDRYSAAKVYLDGLCVEDEE